jgi:hypothetical protein
LQLHHSHPELFDGFAESTGQAKQASATGAVTAIGIARFNLH